MKVGYLTGEYPRATDTFIQREILAVERCGTDVERFAVRRPGDEHMVGERQRSERERTTYLLEGGAVALATATLRAALRSPRRFARALALAASTRRPGLAGAGKQVAYFLEAAALSALLAERGVQHLHNHFGDSSCTVAMLASALGGVPYSFTLHGPAIFFEPYEWHLGDKLRTASFVATISNFARSQASLFVDSAVWPRLHIVHCGVDVPDVVAPSPAGATCRLVFVGRLDQVKGVVVLFDAVASLVESGVDLHLTLVGDGPQRAELESRAAAAGITGSVTFAGYRNESQVQEHLRDADVFVLPSFAEGVPVSLMEAMAAGRPVIATNVGGVTELVRDGVNGAVVAPGDVAALAAAISALSGDPDLRRSLGEHGRATVAAEFDSSTEARRLVALFEGAPGVRGGAIRPEPVAGP